MTVDIAKKECSRCKKLLAETLFSAAVEGVCVYCKADDMDALPPPSPTAAFPTASATLSKPADLVALHEGDPPALDTDEIEKAANLGLGLKKPLCLYAYISPKLASNFNGLFSKTSSPYQNHQAGLNL